MKPAENTSNSAHDQRARLLRHLQHYGSCSTITAREDLDIMSPAPRVLELRKRGVKITTYRRKETTIQGHKHKMGLYVLVSSKASDAVDDE